MADANLRQTFGSCDQLTEEARVEAARVLIESFRDYPYMRYVLADSGAAYEADLEALVLFIVEARYARRHPVLGIREEEALAAVATVVEPGPAERSPEVESLFQKLRSDLGEAAFERMERYEVASHVGRPEEPFHYLGMLGVLPGRQGAGHGKVLVEAVKALAREHPTSTGVCLNTETPSNVALYEFLGFVVVGEADVADMHTWCMLWSPAEDDR